MLDEGKEAISCRPADLIDNEMGALTQEFSGLVKEHNLEVKQGDDFVDDVLTYALFTQVGLNFIKNRDNPSAFEPVPTGKSSSVPSNDAGEAIYTVEVEGQSYTVTVNEGGDLTGIAPIGTGAANTGAPAASSAAPVTSGGEPINAPLAGNVINVPVTAGQQVSAGDTILILEAMKMETNISAPNDGQIVEVKVREGDSVTVGDVLLTIA